MKSYWENDRCKFILMFKLNMNGIKKNVISVFGMCIRNNIVRNKVL